MGHSHRFGQKKTLVNCPPNIFVCPETGQKNTH